MCVHVGVRADSNREGFVNIVIVDNELGRVWMEEDEEDEDGRTKTMDTMVT